MTAVLSLNGVCRRISVSRSEPSFSTSAYIGPNAMRTNLVQSSGLTPLRQRCARKAFWFLR